ncbi:MAG: hypothetical protein LIP01_02940 [Tannerellaceae bacterium]|nr:hypothetical protein [Tannerellaceae bacterium]
MNKFYQTNRHLKNIYVTDEGIKASIEDYGTLEEFLKKIQSGTNSDLDSQIDIFYQSITQVVPYPETSTILINFKEGEEEYSSCFEFENQRDGEEVLRYILTKHPDLKLTRIVNKPSRYILSQSLYGLAIVLFVVGMAYSAWNLQQGGTVEISGRRRGLKQLMITVGGILGVWGTLFCGILVLVGFSYFSWKKYQELKDERDGYVVEE